MNCFILNVKNAKQITKPEINNGFVKLSFYVNTSYPKGCWENHTLS